MRKIFMLLVACVAMVFVSCSKDDDGENGGTTNKNGKRLVSKITCIDEDGSSEYTFLYASDGQIEKMNCIDRFGFTFESSTTLSRSGNKLTTTYVEEDAKDVVTIYTLNDKGYVSDYKNKHGILCQCEYDNNDYLIKGNNTGAIYT